MVNIQRILADAPKYYTLQVHVAIASVFVLSTLGMKKDVVAATVAMMKPVLIVMLLFATFMGTVVIHAFRREHSERYGIPLYVVFISNTMTHIVPLAVLAYLWITNHSFEVGTSCTFNLCSFVLAMCLTVLYCTQTDPCHLYLFTEKNVCKNLAALNRIMYMAGTLLEKITPP